MRNLAVILFALICCRTTAGQDSIAKEMMDRQLKSINETPADVPVILRLDQQMEELLTRANKLPEADRVKFVADGLSPQHQLYAKFGMPDLNEFAKYLLGKARYPKVNLHRDAFAGRDLSAEIRAAYKRCCDLYGKPLSKAPLYKLAFGYQLTTNAQTEGIDRRLGRHIVVLNRSALAGGRSWQAAIIHESWHCFQIDKGKTLLENAMFEGVVTHLTQVVDPTLEDHEVMLWSKAEWDAATARRDAIIRAFAKDRDSTDPQVKNRYMILGQKLTSVPGAPSRCGYYVALLAVRGWQKAHPDLGAAELLATNPDDLWRTLPMETKP